MRYRPTLWKVAPSPVRRRVWWFAGKDELEGAVEDVDHTFVFVLVVDLDAAAGSKAAEGGDEGPACAAGEVVHVDSLGPGVEHVIGCGAEDPYVVGGGARRPVEQVS